MKSFGLTSFDSLFLALHSGHSLDHFSISLGSARSFHIPWMYFFVACVCDM